MLRCSKCRRGGRGGQPDRQRAARLLAPCVGSHRSVGRARKSPTRRRIRLVCYIPARRTRARIPDPRCPTAPRRRARLHQHKTRHPSLPGPLRALVAWRDLALPKLAKLAGRSGGLIAQACDAQRREADHELWGSGMHTRDAFGAYCVRRCLHGVFCHSTAFTRICRRGHAHILSALWPSRPLSFPLSAQRCFPAPATRQSIGRAT